MPAECVICRCQPTRRVAPPEGRTFTNVGPCTAVIVGVPPNPCGPDRDSAVCEFTWSSMVAIIWAFQLAAMSFESTISCARTYEKILEYQESEGGREYRDIFSMLC